MIKKFMLTLRALAFAVLAIFSLGSVAAHAKSADSDFRITNTAAKANNFKYNKAKRTTRRAKKRTTKRRSTKRRTYRKRRTSSRRTYRKRRSAKRRSYRKRRTSYRRSNRRRRSAKLKRRYRGGRGNLRAILRRVKPAGLPYRLAAAVVTVESAWKVHARGSSGEKGLMQLMPGTARMMGGGNMFDPATNLRAGTKYLYWCYKRAKRSVPATIGCYNRGPGKMWQWSGNPITRRYVAKVRRYM